MADPGIVELLVGGMIYPVSYHPLFVCSLPPRPCPSRPLLSPARYMERGKPSRQMLSMHMSKKQSAKHSAIQYFQKNMFIYQKQH